jgi:hypothetical protein
MNKIIERIEREAGISDSRQFLEPQAYDLQ